MSFSVVVLIWIVSATSERSAQAKGIQSDINRLNQEKQTLQQRLQAVQSALSPEQQQALKSAHELVDRKRFSWTRLFGDLESALPNGVRVTRIAVRNVSAQAGRPVADLELTVVAATPTTVTDMIAEMDHGGIFHGELNSQSIQKGRGEIGAEYELSVHYTPRASFPSSAAEGARAEINRSPTDSTGGPR